MNLVIIGAGDMGEWFAKFGKRKGWSVSITDIDEEKAQKTAEELDLESFEDPVEAVENAEIVLISVPIKETPKVIEEIAEHLERNSLLVDIASVKEEVVTKMKEIDSKCELASIHPLFGPGAKNLNEKNIVSIPVKAGEKYREIREILSNLGANVVEMNEREHDRLMSRVQALTHFTMLAYIHALNSMSDSEKEEIFQTPISNKLLELTKAFLRENPELCGEIQIENRYAPMARNSLREAVRSLDLALDAENSKIVKEIFREARDKINPEDIESAYRKIYEKEDN